MNRRTFLRAAGLCAAALAIPGAWSKEVAEGIFPAKALAPTPGKGLRLSFTPYELRLRHAFNLAKFSRTTTPDVLVSLTCDGVTGYGEASMPPYLGESVESVTKFLGSLDLSRFSDPFRMEEIHEYMDSVAPRNTAAKAAVDIALHDLAGKIMGRQWHSVWGLDSSRAPHTSFTIGIDEPDVVRQKVDEATPYRVLKVKMGLDRDKETVEVIRSMTDRPICVDANQGWDSREQALDMCHWLSERGCLFVEQPLPMERVDDTAWLRERSPLPIVADEFLQGLDDIPRAMGVYDAVNIKLMKCGGLHEAHKMAVTARALGMKVMLGCMTETSCAISAAAQLAPLADWCDLDGNLLIANDCFTGMKIVDGRVTLPGEGAGIGVTPLRS